MLSDGDENSGLSPKAILGASTTSILGAAEVEETGDGRVAAAGFAAGVADARDVAVRLPDDLVAGDCEKALTKPAAVFDARWPTDDDTLDAMDEVAAAG